MTFGPDPRKYPSAKAVVAKFQAKNFNPEAYTLYSLRGARGDRPGGGRQAKSLDPKKVAAEVRSRQDLTRP